VLFGTFEINADTVKDTVDSGIEFNIKARLSLCNRVQKTCGPSCHYEMEREAAGLPPLAINPHGDKPAWRLITNQLTTYAPADGSSTRAAT